MQRLYSDDLNPPPSFNLIYQSALLQSDIHLANYFNQPIASVDVKAGGKFGVITPAGLHAMHGNDDAVTFLVSHHADIDYIGYGAALANRVETAEFWRKKHGAHPDMLARGAAYAGNVEYATRLNQQYGANHLEIGIGLIMGAHHAKFKQWLLQTEYYLNDDDLAQLAVAAGIAGKTSIGLTDLLADKPGIIEAMNTGSAIAGRSDFNRTRATMSPGVENGLMAGGHLLLLPADAYDSRDSARLAWKCSNIDFLVMYYEKNKRHHLPLLYSAPLTVKAIADSGDVNLIKHVAQHHPEIIPNVAPMYFFKLSNPKAFKILCYYYTINPTLKESIKEFIQVIRLLPNTAIVLHSFVFYSNDSFNALLLETVNEDQNMTQRITVWMKKANYMRQLMQRYEFNFDQALAIMNSPDLRHLLLQTVKDINTCFPELPVDMKAAIITHLCQLNLADAKDIIMKVRHYNLIVMDIRRIAAAFEQYGVKIPSPLKERALNLSTSLYAIRNHATAVEILSKEFIYVLDVEITKMDNNLRSKRSLGNRKFGLFSKSINDVTAKHYEAVYSDLVLNHFHQLSHKIVKL